MKRGLALFFLQPRRWFVWSTSRPSYFPPGNDLVTKV